MADEHRPPSPRQPPNPRQPPSPQQPPTSNPRVSAHSHH
jgi:hypothetical protein